MKDLGYVGFIDAATDAAGFAAGRTSFWDALVNCRENRTTREAPVHDIAGRSRAFVDLFQEQVRAA